MRRVQRASVTSQLLHVFVNGFGTLIMRDADLLLEDQLMPDAATAAARTSSHQRRSFSYWYAFAATRLSALVMPHRSARGAEMQIINLLGQ